MKKILFLLLNLGLLLSTMQADQKFSTYTGMIMIGGQGNISVNTDFKDSIMFHLQFNPLFGQFITREALIFTHFDLGFNIGQNKVDCWIGMGIQGRYFFSTEEALNFYLALDVSLGLKVISDAFKNLNTEIAIGPVAGFIVPVNSNLAFDFSLMFLYIHPINTAFTSGFGGFFTNLTAGLLCVF